MTDNTQPDAREFTMSQYASKDCMIGAMRERIADLEAQLEAIGAGGVSGPLMGRAVDHFRDVTQMMSRWYVLNKDGMATLCADRRDAEKEAKYADMAWPHSGPHRAVQLVEAGSASLSASAGEPEAWLYESPMPDGSVFTGEPAYSDSALLAREIIESQEDSLLICASDLQHSAIYDNHVEMQSCMRAVAERITDLAALAAAPQPSPTAQAAESVPAADWTQPTTVAQRLADAVQLLCGGKRPPDAMVRGWLDYSSEELQSFAASHGPSWAQGIGLIDAAMVMVDQPTEITTIDHQDRDHERRAARATAESVTAPAGGADWQDISTAPKDGTRFVAVGQNYGLDSEAQHTCIAQWLAGCWVEVSDWNGASKLKYLTHWMPLPPLPGSAARAPEDSVTAPAGGVVPEALYAAAMEFAAEKASIAYVQRKCRCSYNDAERMLERMVNEGFIETYNGRKSATTAQPAEGAANVQNPAEIEHVAGDVSKTGEESNMSTQQPAPAAQQAGAVRKIDRGFRWDGENLQHVPTLLLEFEPVPANSPCDAKGWQDRDAVADRLSTTTAQAAESVPAPVPPPECETEAEKRAFAFGWFKAQEVERMKADSVLEDAARLLRQMLAASQDGDSDTHLSAHFVSRIETITKAGGAA